MVSADPIAALVKHATTTTTLGSLINQSTFMVSQMHELLKNDDELVPELASAVEHMTEYVRALERAHDFSQARLEVAVDGE